jgi:CDP-diacylglycerol---glycerol-3-phosphate 3-phosphatidyltransferase
MTLTDTLRKIFSSLIKNIAEFLIQIGLSANTVTLIGFGGNIIAALLISQSKLFLAGIVAGLSCLLDAFDGAVAKEGEGVSQFGSFLDSTLDRYSEYVLFLGLVFHFQAIDDRSLVLVTFIAFGGSILVSYIRAKGDSLGISIKDGLFTRVERLLVLIASLVFEQPKYGLLAIAIFANITAIQRFFIARKLLSGKGK